MKREWGHYLPDSQQSFERGIRGKPLSGAILPKKMRTDGSLQNFLTPGVSADIP